MTKTEPGARTEPEASMTPDANEDRQGRPIARFVQEHPALAIAGGLAIGVLAAALLPRRNRAFVSRKSSELGEAIGAAGLMLYREALDRAESAGDEIRDIAGRIGESQSDRKNGASAWEGFHLQDTLAGLARHLRGRSEH